MTLRTASGITVTDLLGDGIGAAWLVWNRKIDLIPAGSYVLDHVTRDDWPGDDDGWVKFARLQQRCAAAGRRAAGQPDPAPEPAPEPPHRIPIDVATGDSMWRPLQHCVHPKPHGCGAVLDQTPHVDEIAAWIADTYTSQPPTTGWVLAGPTGTGKTAIAAAIAHDLDDRGAFWTAADLVRHIVDADTTGRGQGSATRNHIIDRTLLVIDDLGDEGPGPNGWHTRIIREVLEGRHRRRLITIITTNLTPHDITSRYGRRILSRLQEACQWRAMDGADRRTAA
jgi:hypothetical protein